MNATKQLKIDVKYNFAPPNGHLETSLKTKFEKIPWKNADALLIN